jgi:hypothetical protein
MRQPIIFLDKTKDKKLKRNNKIRSEEFSNIFRFRTGLFCKFVPEFLGVS